MPFHPFDAYDEAFWASDDLISFHNLQRIDHTLPDKKIAAIVFQCHHVRIYLMYEKLADGCWTLTGMAKQSDRYINDNGWCDFHIVTGNYSDDYWLVLTTEVDHGTDLSVFNQIWYKDGSEALQ